MPFSIAAVSPSKPGNVAHFWNVTADDTDTQSDWIMHGFSETPQEYTIFDVNGFAKTYTGFYRVEINTTTVDAKVPAWSYVAENGLTVNVAEKTVFDAPVGSAFRVLKSNIATSGGPTRVKVAYYPGDLG